MGSLLAIHIPAQLAQHLLQAVTALTPGPTMGLAHQLRGQLMLQVAGLQHGSIVLALQQFLFLVQLCLLPAQQLLDLSLALPLLPLMQLPGMLLHPLGVELVSQEQLLQAQLLALQLSLQRLQIVLRLVRRCGWHGVFARSHTAPSREQPPPKLSHSMAESEVAGQEVQWGTVVNCHPQAVATRR